jgi:hypothetical protein
MLLWWLVEAYSQISVYLIPSLFVALYTPIEIGRDGGILTPIAPKSNKGYDPLLVSPLYVIKRMWADH